MRNMKLYLAYGSNMSRAQMAYRCPDASVIGYADIEDYELLFKGSKSGNYATIEPKQGSKVPVLVWLISEKDEESLDLYEGVAAGFYYKKNLKVNIRSFSLNRSMGEYEAMVYIMDERRQEGPPSVYYYEILHEAYNKFNFEMETLVGALERSILKNPKLSKKSNK